MAKKILTDLDATNRYITAAAYNKTAITAPATGATIAIGNLKTFSVNATLTLTGTDSSTLNVGAGGTLGTAAFTSSTAYAVSKNYIINSAFDIAQRGTSGLTATGTSGGATTSYTLDQWIAVASATASPGVTVLTVSRQDSTANMISGYDFPYYANVVTSLPVSGTVTGSSYFSQRIEDVRTLAGQQVTLSFWAKISSGTNSNITPVIVQNFGTGGSTAVTNTGSAISLTTTWTRFSYTVTLGSMSGKTIGTNSYLDVRPLQLAGANYTALTISIAGVKLEESTAATVFGRMSESLASELIACQRYYWRFGGSGTATQVSVANGAYYNTTTCYSSIRHPVSMRTSPSFSVNDTAALTAYAGGSSRASTNITGGTVVSREATEISVTTSAATSGHAAFIRFPANSTNYMEFSAEI